MICLTVTPDRTKVLLFEVMLSSPPLPEPSPNPRSFFNNSEQVDDDDDDGADTASQRSISLSSAPGSPRHTHFGSALNDLARQHQPTSSSRDSDVFSNRSSQPYTVNTDFDDGSSSMFQETPSTSAAPSVYDQIDRDLSKEVDLPTYPPSTPNRDDRDRVSLSSLASQSSRKARPESLLVTLPDGPLILGIALVDFNHLVLPLYFFWNVTAKCSDRSDHGLNIQREISSTVRR